MAEPKKNPKQRKSRYTADRGIAGAWEGETVTRRRVFEIGAQGVGGIAVAAIALPSLGFALGPMFEDGTHPGVVAAWLAAGTAASAATAARTAIGPPLVISFPRSEEQYLQPEMTENAE